MKRIIVLLVIMVCLTIPAFGNNTVKAEQQKLEIGLNQPVTVSAPGSSENKRFVIYLPQSGLLQINFTFTPKEEYIVTVYSISSDGTLESRYSMGCIFYGETATGIYTEQSDRLRLPAGTYFIDVKDNNGWGWINEGLPYTILPAFTPEPEDRFEKEFNDKARYAMYVEPDRQIIGNLSSSSDEDYYRVSLPSRGSLQVEFYFDTESWYDMDLFSVDSGGGLKKIDSMWAHMDGESVWNLAAQSTEEIQVDPGDYYLHVYPSQGTFSLSPEHRTDKDYYVTFKFNPA